jgi:DNA-binding transcriptional LysR family regulator
MLTLVRDEVVDLGIIGGNCDHPEVESLFRTQDSMHVVCPKAHPITKVRAVTAAALARYPLIMMDPETSVRKVVDEAFHAAGLMPNPVCEVTYMMTAIGFKLGSASPSHRQPPAKFRSIRSCALCRSKAAILFATSPL